MGYYVGSVWHSSTSGVATSDAKVESKIASSSTSSSGSTSSSASNKAKAETTASNISNWLSDEASKLKSSNTNGEDTGTTGTGTTYYSGGSSGDSSSGSSSTSTSTKDWSTAIDEADANKSEDTILNSKAGDATKNLISSAGLDEDVEIAKVDHVDTTEEEAMLKQLKEAQEQQAVLSANNTVDTGIKEAQRAQQDAQTEYQTQRNQIDADEQRALDNQVLYAKTRGDNGGIGQSQYNSIQNTAATNRLTVQNAQTKLATDTARQIADLRAQGEFEKADSLLTISQNYLSQLMSLKQWADETNVSIDEFNSQIDEWKQNFKVSLLNAEISAANVTGAFSDGTPTYTAYSARQSQLASIGNTLMQAGVAPTTEMLNAMGMNKTQGVSYLNRYYSGGSV